MKKSLKWAPLSHDLDWISKFGSKWDLPININFNSKYQVTSSKMAKLWQVVRKRTSIYISIKISYILIYLSFILCLQVILESNSVWQHWQSKSSSMCYLYKKNNKFVLKGRTGRPLIYLLDKINRTFWIYLIKFGYSLSGIPLRILSTSYPRSPL